MRIVLDLSALRGLPGARIAALCSEHEVWMVEGLFYELMTTEHHDARAAAFRKIGPGSNPMRLVGNAGYLWGRERAHGRPARPVEDSELQAVRWIFNARLADPAYRPLEQLPELVAWQRHMHANVADFEQRARIVGGALFPHLSDVRAGQLDRVAPVLHELGADPGVVIDIYRQMAEAAGEGLPAEFGPTWMGFRLIQAQLIWAVDHIGRFGAGDVAVAAPRMENTFCDVEYAAIAAHADALLTNDALQARLFRTMAPAVYCGPDVAVW